MLVKAMLLAAFLTISAGVAAAIEIDFSTKLTDLDGKVYRDCVKPNRTNPADVTCDEWIEHTLGLIAYSALDRPEQGGNVLDHARRGALARQVYKGGKVDLTTKQIDQIIEQIGKMQLRPAELLQVIELLDPARLK